MAKIQKLGPKQKRWLNALESGHYKQAREKLFNGIGYCCLGVACAIEKIKPEKVSRYTYKFGGSSQIPPARIWRALKLRSANGKAANSMDCLAQLNDTKKLKFREIAALIRENPAEYFTGPA